MRESRNKGPRLQAAGGWMLILLLVASQLSVSHGSQGEHILVVLIIIYTRSYSAAADIYI